MESDDILENSPTLDREEEPVELDPSAEAGSQTRTYRPKVEDRQPQRYYSVQELIRMLSDAIRRESKEISVRVKDEGIAYRLSAVMTDVDDLGISLWLRKDSYEPITLGKTLQMEIPQKGSFSVMHTGKSTFSGFDFDVLSFLKDTDHTPQQ